jgi:hypothetical protein
MGGREKRKRIERKERAERERQRKREREREREREGEREGQTANGVDQQLENNNVGAEVEE